MSGVPHVNAPRAVHNTYRDRMIAVLDEANVPFIPSRVVATSEHPDAGRAAGLGEARRRPQHAGRRRGVRDDGRRRRDARFAGWPQRGIKRAVLQPHVEGDLIKFYGIGAGGGPHREPPWFRWFYHKDQKLSGNPLDQRQLARLVRRAASALGLEVYGGDAIATAAGELVLLDVNAWPSFALYRDEASAAIASYLALRFSGGKR